MYWIKFSPWIPGNLWGFESSDWLRFPWSFLWSCEGTQVSSPAVEKYLGCELERSQPSEAPTQRGSTSEAQRPTSEALRWTQNASMCFVNSCWTACNPLKWKYVPLRRFEVFEWAPQPQQFNINQYIVLIWIIWHTHTQQTHSSHKIHKAHSSVEVGILPLDWQSRSTVRPPKPRTLSPACITQVLATNEVEM